MPPSAAIADLPLPPPGANVRHPMDVPLLRVAESSAMFRAEVGRGTRAASRQMRAAMIPEDVADHPSADSVGESGHAAPLRLEEFLPYRLNVVANLVSQALSRIYAERYDIGVPEWRVLVTLGQYGVMTAKQIGEHTHMHKTKVSRAVAQLEKRKFVARRANRDDLRESFLSLAAPGRTIYEDLAPSALEFAARSSGGVVVPSTDLDGVSARLRLLDRPVEARRTRPMHSAWWMVPFCGLLGLEWTLRRRRGQR